MKKILIIIFLSTIFISLIFSEEITLDEGLKLLSQNNIQIKTLESKLRQAKYKKFETFSSWLPKLQLQAQFVQLSEPQIKLSQQMSMMFSSMFSPVMTSDKYYSANATVSQLLFSSGKVFSAYKISSINYDLIKTEYEKTKQDLEIQYKETFLKTLLAKKMLEVTKKAVEISSENYKVSTELYKEGRVSYLDFSSAKINYFNAEINFLKIKNSYEIAKEGLKNILNVNFEVEPVGELENFLKDTEYDFVKLKKNIQKVYEVKSIDLQKKILLQNLNLTRSEFLPIISLAGNYSWTVDDYNRPIDQWDDRHNWALVISWPIFSSGATYSRYLQNKENLKQINFAKEGLVSSLELQLSSLYSTYLQLKESINLAKQNLTLAEENYKVAKSYYLEGRSSYLEFLQAELGLSNSKVNYYQTLAEYIIVCEKLKKFDF